MPEAWDPIWYETQIKNRALKWECWVFGDPDLLVIRTPKNVSWLTRLRTSIFLGSRWKKLNHTVEKRR
jgi:hypothetical protein